MNPNTRKPTLSKLNCLYFFKLRDYHSLRAQARGNSCVKSMFPYLLVNKYSIQTMVDFNEFN